MIGRRIRDEGGVIYAEFILAFAPFFLLFLGVVQLGLLAAAGLVVQTGATKAVRAAAVVLDDDPVFYAGEPRRLLDFNGSAADDGWVNNTGGVLNDKVDVSWLQHQNCPDSAAVTKTVNGKDRKVCCDAGGSNCTDQWTRTNQVGGMENHGGPRLRAIRRAAYMPLATISPEWSTMKTWFPMLPFLGDEAPSRYSLQKTAIGTDPGIRFVTGFLVYNPVAAAINFPEKPGSDNLLNQDQKQVEYGLKDNVTVRITYLFPCAVPIVNNIICSSLFALTGIQDTLNSVKNLVDKPKLSDLLNVRTEMQSIWDKQKKKGKEFEKLFHELQSGVENPDLQMALFLVPGARFYILRREATLPIQGAPICYPTDKSEDCPKEKEDS